MNLRPAFVAVAIAIGATAGTNAPLSAGLPTGVPYAAPDDPVRIAAVELPSDTLRGGQMATATVITTSNAAAVTAKIGGYLLDVPKTAPGTFVAAVRIPRLPLPSYRARIVVTAIRADGATDQTTVSVKIKY